MPQALWFCVKNMDLSEEYHESTIKQRKRKETSTKLIIIHYISDLCSLHHGWATQHLTAGLLPLFLHKGAAANLLISEKYFWCFVLTNRRRLYVSESQDTDFPFLMRSLLLQLFLSHWCLIQQFLEALLWIYKTSSLGSSLCNFRYYKFRKAELKCLFPQSVAFPLDAYMLLQKV